MTSDVRPLVEFLEAQRSRQASHFATVKFPKVLSFMATTSKPGSHATVGVLPVSRLEPGSSASEMRVHLGGRLPRAPAAGECVTVHVDKLDQYQGYQIKTAALAAGASPDALCRAEDGGIVVEGRHIYTVHHSPYTMKFFEQIPYEEVEQIVGGVKYALVGLGESVNISPRFVFHVENRGDKLTLFHGDGLALKTYMNLKQNRQETRIVVDLDTFEGWAIEGTVGEFAPHQHPEAYDRICQGFTAGNWGKPSRVFRFVADRWMPIAPVRA